MHPAWREPNDAEWEEIAKNPEKTIIGLNTQVFDATKHQALPMIADARVGLEELSANLGSYKAPESWTKSAADGFKAWVKDADAVTQASNTLPSDAQVIGAVQRARKQIALFLRQARPREDEAPGPDRVNRRVLARITAGGHGHRLQRRLARENAADLARLGRDEPPARLRGELDAATFEIGRASCRERVLRIV